MPRKPVHLINLGIPIEVLRLCMPARTKDTVSVRSRRGTCAEGTAQRRGKSSFIPAGHYRRTRRSVFEHGPWRKSIVPRKPAHLINLGPY